MSRRAMHHHHQQQQPGPAAAAGGSSRRTSRRAELLLPRPPASLAESPHQIVSNPIFRCEAGPSQPNRPPPPGDQLRCVYGPGSLYALVHDPDPAAAASVPAGSGVGKAHQRRPLPLPPCRAHPSGRVGPARAVGGPHGRVLRRAPAPHDDPFLAAYVACSKSAAGDEVVDRAQHQQKQGRRRRTKEKAAAAAGRKCKEGEVLFRGCGIWSGWPAGSMSCRYGCAVAGQKGDAPATTAAKSEDDAPAGPTLDLSWTPAVLSARARERREQR